jgi:hypothetical protein
MILNRIAQCFVVLVFCFSFAGGAFAKAANEQQGSLVIPSDAWRFASVDREEVLICPGYWGTLGTCREKDDGFSGWLGNTRMISTISLGEYLNQKRGGDFEITSIDRSAGGLRVHYKLASDSEGRALADREAPLIAIPSERRENSEPSDDSWFPRILIPAAFAGALIAWFLTTETNGLSSGAAPTPVTSSMGVASPPADLNQIRMDANSEQNDDRKDDPGEGDSDKKGRYRGRKIVLD